MNPVLLLILGVCFQADGQETLKLKTQRGDEIEAVVHFPKEKDKAPAIVIAPGQGYHKELPLIKSFAERAASAGFVAVRFDWHYFTKKGRPSGDLDKEIQDMQAVIDFVTKHARVDSRRVMLAGKSLGTIVAYAHFQKRKESPGLILLTPVFRSAKEAASFYPKLAEEKRPVVLVSGNRDPIGKLDVLHGVLKDAGSNVVNVVVGGDHGLNLGSWKDSAWKKKNAANISAAVNVAVHWMSVILDRE